MKDFLERIEKSLERPLPGLSAQLRMVPDPRPGNIVYQEMEGNCPHAGVLLLVYPRSGRLCLLLTKRTERVLHHRGQVSFPGGEQLSGETIEETAIRETEEELGFRLDSARILGKLTPIYIPPSNFCVYPMVAFLTEEPTFRLQEEEVEDVLEIPLEHLVDSRNTRREEWRLKEKPVSVPYFAFREHKIWGATAMMLAEFLALLER